MADDQHYDVIVIGTGAGGGTLGHRLATGGANVLWLERGSFLPRERDNWESSAVFVRGKYLAPEEWYDRHGQEFQPEVNYYVGGNTKFYGAALFRLRPEDFGELRHHGGISPAWPISYDDLEPYYTQAEHLYVVHGRHGEDPTEGPASAQYAYPPVAHEPRIQQLSDDLEKLGSAPLPPADRGATSTRRSPVVPTRASVCIRCNRVDGFPCLVNGKADSQVICVDPVLGQDNVTLVTGANVRRLETDASGRSVTGVVTELDDGSMTTFTADIVAVACGAVNSAALLLRSANDRHPDGLGQQLRSRRPALHAAQQPCPDGGLAGSPTRPSSRRRWPSTTGTSAPTTGSTRSAGSRCSASPTTSRSTRKHRAGPAGSRQICRSRSWRTTPSTSGSAGRTCPRPTTG